MDSINLSELFEPQKTDEPTEDYISARKCQIIIHLGIANLFFIYGSNC